jgi:hypothetical protein
MRPLRQRISSSEEHPRGKHRPVVIGMELRACHLHSSADYQGEAIAGIMLQLKFAKHQSWSYEVLHPPVVGSAMVKGRVVFDLWPKEFPMWYCLAAFHRTGRPSFEVSPAGSTAPSVDCTSKRFEAFARAQSRRNSCCETSILAASSRQRAGPREAHRIIAVLGVSGHQTVFQQQGEITCAILGRRIVLDVRRARVSNSTLYQGTKEGGPSYFRNSTYPSPPVRFGGRSRCGLPAAVPTTP